VDKGIQNALMKLSGLQGSYEPRDYYQGLSDVMNFAGGPKIEPGAILNFDQNAMNGLTKAVQVRTAALQTNQVAKFTEDHYAIGTAAINTVNNLAFVGLMYSSYLSTSAPKTSPMDSDMIDAEIANSNTYNPNAAKEPVTGSQWNNYFSETYGAGNVEWETGEASVSKACPTTSKLQEVFDIADNYTLADDVYQNHILDRHGAGSNYINKSQFSSDYDILQGIDDTLTGSNSIVKPNTGGRSGFIFENTYSNPIGIGAKGKMLNTLKVVIDESGNVVTAFPK